MLSALAQAGQATPVPFLFFTVKAMVQWTFDGVLVGPSLLDQVITQLRLLTMMRSSDVANLMSGILTFQDIFLVRTTDKGGLERYFNVGGLCLHSLCKYMVQHVQSPAPHLLRYLDRPNRCLGSERVAKRFLGVLNQHGVDTTIFKAHSLRGGRGYFSVTVWGTQGLGAMPWGLARCVDHERVLQPLSFDAELGELFTREQGLHGGIC